MRWLSLARTLAYIGKLLKRFNDLYPFESAVASMNLESKLTEQKQKCFLLFDIIVANWMQLKN
jgi:hypothetical protein